jgi:DNA-binding transcriptional MerR regulator/methylmalonyl-CoA mutase cobalamin-binding subunit
LSKTTIFPMNDRTVNTALQLSIAAVERDTGIGKDTLRVWERRYGFPQPHRDASGDRLYPLDQVERLRVIKRLLDGGHRPAQVVALPIDELDALARGRSSVETSPDAAAASGSEQMPTQSAEVHAYLALLKRHDAELLRRALLQDAMRMGISRFVTEVVAPLNYGVGQAWMRGELEVFEEHLYSEVIQRVLRTAIDAIPLGEAAQSRPKVLMTTVPQEPHVLGLLMAEAMLALEGCRCVQLGAQLPLGNMLMAAQAHAADVLVLSFSSLLQAAQVFDALAELRDRLPRAVELWAGGSNPALRKRLPEGVRVTAALTDLAHSVHDWRERHRVSGF